MFLRLPHGLLAHKRRIDSENACTRASFYWYGRVSVKPFVVDKWYAEVGDMHARFRRVRVSSWETGARSVY